MTLKNTKIPQLFCITAIIILIITIGGCTQNPAGLNRETIAELNRLDKILNDAQNYDAKQIHAIDSLRRQLHNTPISDLNARWNITMQIGERYRLFRTDSAINYFDESRKIALESHSDSLKEISEISYIKALSVAGLFTEAEHEISTLDSIDMSPDMRLELWKALRQHYSYITAYVEGYDKIEEKARQKHDYYTELILKNTNSTDAFHRFLLAEQQVTHSHYREAKLELERLLSELKPEDNLYGMAAYRLADVYRLNSDEENHVRYLALAAISDIKGSVKETLALQTLAKRLMNNKDYDRAYNYINASYRNSSNANVKMRTLAISEMLPTIDQAYKTRISQSRDKLKIYLILTITLCLLIAFMFVMRLRQMKKITQAQQRLSRVSKIQETYIGHILGLCASYADKLNALSKLVVRKITSGQSDDLLRLVKTGKFAEDQNDEFYKVFDNAFLDINPDFIDKINLLLRDDQRFNIAKGESLPAELRIYAFVKLGVEESVKIAQILNYSPATVYTYRNRMRNRAINRDSFDTDVCKIGG